MYDYGVRLNADEFGKGDKWINKAAQKGVPRALLQLLTTTSTIENKYHERIEYAERIYQSEEADCIYFVACLFGGYGDVSGLVFSSLFTNNIWEDGNLVKTWDFDYENSLKFLKRAASLGYQSAQYDLGLIYCFGGLPHKNRKDIWYISDYPTQCDYEESYRLFKASGCTDDEYNMWATRSMAGDGSDSNLDEFKGLTDNDRAIAMFSILLRNGYPFAGWLLTQVAYNTGKYQLVFDTFKYLTDNFSGKMDKWPFSSIYNIISSCYRFGRGCEPDESLADYYLEKYCGLTNYTENSKIREFINDIKHQDSPDTRPNAIPGTE